MQSEDLNHPYSAQNPTTLPTAKEQLYLLPVKQKIIHKIMYHLQYEYCFSNLIESPTDRYAIQGSRSKIQA